MATTYSAYSVYWYDTNKVGYGMAGRIKDDPSAPLPPLVITASPNMRTDLNGDPKTEGFIDTAGNLRVAVTDRVKNVQRLVYIHDAVSSSTVSTQTWPEQNLYTLTRLGNHLYGIDYDTATVFEVSAAAPYAATGVSYPLAASFIPQGYQAVGQALIVIGGTLFGLFSFPDSAWDNYAPSLLVRFTIAGSGTGRTISVGATDYNAFIAPNAFSLAVNGSDLYIASIGGRQTTSGYNSDSRIQSIAYATVNLTPQALVTDKLAPSQGLPYDMRDISFNPDGTAYVLMGTYKPGPTPTDPWELEGQLVSTTDFSTLTPIDDFTTKSLLGYFWTAKYTSGNNRIWYGRGNDIWVYSAGNSPTIVGTLPMSTLKGGGNYNNLNDLTYVGAVTEQPVKLSGYRSPLQRSNTKFARAARALTQGRPELTEEEFAQLTATYGLPWASKDK